MAIPSSGAISLLTIQTEWGGADPIGVNEYYAGGGLVSAGASGTNGPVPSSGVLSASSFYGTQNVIGHEAAGTAIYNSISTFYKTMGNAANADWRYVIGNVFKTYNFSFPAASYPQGSTWTTIVVMSAIYSGTVSVISTLNGVGGYTPIATAYKTVSGNTYGNSSIAVYQIPMDFRDVTSVVIQGYKQVSNKTFTINCGVFPGKWLPSFSDPVNPAYDGYATTIIGPKNVDLWTGGNTVQNNYPWYYSGMNLPYYGSGYTYLQSSNWWYSCTATLLVVNGSTVSTEYSTGWTNREPTTHRHFDPKLCQLTWITG